MSCYEKKPGKTRTPTPRNSAVFPTPFFSFSRSRFSLFPKPIAFTVAVILTQSVAGVSVGLGPDCQEWVLTDGGDFSALSAVTRLLARPLGWMLHM